MLRTLTCLFVLTLCLAACRKPVPSLPLAVSDGAPPGHPSRSDPSNDAAGGVPDPVRELIEGFRRVHFELDSATLRGVARGALAHNAEILLRHPDVRIEVQGHADERGTIEYNLALGQRRAEAVQIFLSDLGVAPARVQTVSYGEERPRASGRSESAWSANRRAEFRVIWGQRVEGTVASG